MKNKSIKNLYNDDINDLSCVVKVKNMKARDEKDVNYMETIDINNKLGNEEMETDFKKHSKKQLKYLVSQDCNEVTSIYLEDSLLSSKYSLSGIEPENEEYDWLEKKIILDNIFNQSLWRYCTLTEFINEFKVIINNDATIEMIIELIIRFNFPVFIYNTWKNIYYEITAEDLKKLYNGEYSCPYKVIENEITKITFNRSIKDIYVGAYGINQTNEFMKLINNYNQNVREQKRRLEDKKERLRKNSKNIADELKGLIEDKMDESSINSVMESLDKEFENINNIQNKINELYYQEIADEKVISHWYVPYRLGTLKSMNSVIKL